MAKRGRPKVAKGKALGRLITLRLREDDFKKISAAVERSGLRQSAWMRQVLLKEAEVG